MADSGRGASLRQLAHLHDWHISEAAYGEALGRLIDAHRAMPLAGLWGTGVSSSSDGQQFHAGGRGAAIGDINARNGNQRSEVRPVGEECVSTLESRWAPDH